MDLMSINSILRHHARFVHIIVFIFPKQLWSCQWTLTCYRPDNRREEWASCVRLLMDGATTDAAPRPCSIFVFTNGISPSQHDVFMNWGLTPGRRVFISASSSRPLPGCFTFPSTQAAALQSPQPPFKLHHMTPQIKAVCLDAWLYPGNEAIP